MSAAHTPGPWSVVSRMAAKEDGSVFPMHIVGGVTELQVCLMESPAVAEAIVNDAAWQHLADSPMAKANARLIAAAPELLSIARRWAALDGGAWHAERHAREKAALLSDTQAAIAAATGAAS